MKVTKRFIRNFRAAQAAFAEEDVPLVQAQRKKYCLDALESTPTILKGQLSGLFLLRMQRLMNLADCSKALEKYDSIGRKGYRAWRLFGSEALTLPQQFATDCCITKCITTVPSLLVKTFGRPTPLLLRGRKTEVLHFEDIFLDRFIVSVGELGKGAEWSGAEKQELVVTCAPQTSIDYFEKFLVNRANQVIQGTARSFAEEVRARRSGQNQSSEELLRLPREERIEADQPN